MQTSDDSGDNHLLTSILKPTPQFLRLFTYLYSLKRDHIGSLCGALILRSRRDSMAIVILVAKAIAQSQCNARDRFL
jgi:hypothetical protein